MRSRAYCRDCSAPSMLFKPLWPPGEPSPRSRNVPLRSWIPEADDGAQGSALFAALGLLGLLGLFALLALRRWGGALGRCGRALRFGLRATLGGLALGLLLALAYLADQLRLGHLGHG